MPTASAAFLNPVQEFNRDLSVLAIRAWSEMIDEELKARWVARGERKRGSNGQGGQGKKRRAKGGHGGEEQGEAKKVKAGKYGQVREQEYIEQLGSYEGPCADDAAVDEQQVAESSAAGAAAAAAASAGATTSASEATTATTNPTSQPQETPAETSEASASATTSDVAAPTPGYRPFRFTVLEALSATGLRSIRYAREIPLLKQVVANDLSASAVVAMKRNVALNFPQGRPIEEWVPDKEEDDGKADAPAPAQRELTEDEMMDLENNGGAAAATTANDTTTDPSAADESASAASAIHPSCKITINEGDALDVMYTHRSPGSRYHVVDLDPYGTASPFLDGAVQCVADGGLLAVTCTDLAVLAANNYPEKAFALYGGSCTRTEYCHEVALRLVLNAIASSAAKYGRHIKPLLSLSIDFYVRLFIQVDTAPIEVKKLASKTGLVYTCSYCHNFHEQRLGRVTETFGKKGGSTLKYQNGQGPTVGSECEECGSRYLAAGPMWLDPIHDPAFCERLLSVLDRDPARSKTAPRIRGMVGTAAKELPNSPFYFAPAKVSGLMHSESPTFVGVASALLNAGYEVSRSHCQPGSIKTNATRAQCYDIWRKWIADGHPVKVEGMAEASPAGKLVTKEKAEGAPVYSFEEHPDAKRLAARDDSGKAVRYQQNPLPNWGPGTAAAKGTGKANKQQ